MTTRPMYQVVTYSEGRPVTGPLTMNDALKEAETRIGSNEYIEPVTFRESPDRADGTTHLVGARVRELSLDDEAACTWLYRVRRLNQSLATQGI